MSSISIPDYAHTDASGSEAMRYISRVVLPLLPPKETHPRVLDVGSGNGSFGKQMIDLGYEVVGVDPSQRGIEVARRAYPEGRWELGTARPGMIAELGIEPVDVVTSTEVIEHIYAPREWADGCFEALRPGGVFIVTTPYHGFLKNLAISLTNGWDNHFTVHWDGGHIKFWSRATLGNLLRETGFEVTGFAGAGRLPYLWKSMVLVAQKPAGR